jgi:preprotein translocase subunit SecF
MTLLIIGLSLSFIAIGILFYFNKQLKRKLELTNKALLAFQKEFTQYQVNEKRSHEKETAKREIRFDNVARAIKKNEDFINVVNQKHKDLPETIRNVVGHIEFARPLDKK